MSSDSFLDRLRHAQRNPDIPVSVQSKTDAPWASHGAPRQTSVRTDTLWPELADHADYQVVRELGRGGMGVVYLAHNRLMGRDEVLKVVGKHLIERKGVIERFSREIRSAARLTHPNIVHAYSAFRVGESIVFAMEYAEGLDLAKVVKAKGSLPVAHACNYIYQAAMGLQHAHEQGMVHRDIKPGNLMLARNGDKAVVKVLDFGLAKATRESPVEGGLTHEGQMLGTPDFIAPEQIRDAQSAGIQADIYSLGCTLYYLLTGTPPFEATSLYDLLQAHFSMDAQPLNLVRPEVPSELAALVAKMMAKDPKRRFQTPAEVAEALKPFFKKVGTGSKAEIPTIAQPDARTAMAQEAPGKTEPATPTDRQAGSASEPTSISSLSQPQPVGALEKTVPAADSPQVVPETGQKPGNRPPGRPVWLTLASGALGFVALGIVIIIVTKNNRVTIDTDKGRSVVTVEHSKTQDSNQADAQDDVTVHIESSANAPTDRGIGVASAAHPETRSNSSQMTRQVVEALTGAWEMVGDALRGTSGIVLLGDCETAEYDLRFKARIVAGDRFEVVLHYESPFNFVGLEVGDNGGRGVSLHHYENLSRRTLATKSVATAANCWYDMRVEVRKSGHQFYRDNALLLTYVGGDMVGHRLGLRAGGSEPGTVLFKDIEIRSRDGASLFSKLPTRIMEPEKTVLQAAAANEPGVAAVFQDARTDLTKDQKPDRVPKEPNSAEVKVTTNSIGMKLVLIPAGEFLMGSPDPNGAANERPEHRVKFSTPFYMGATEVTQGQYQAVMGTNPSYFSPQGEGREKVAGKPNSEYPVEQVSWFDAVLFCNGLSVKERLAPYYRVAGEQVMVLDAKGPGYRLPTEAEWEYAARGGKSGPYSPGPEPLVEYGWFRANSDGSTHPVAKKAPNKFGLYDMAANVWEWCFDEYSAEYYKKSPEVDPPGPSGMSTRVRRGGSGWRSPQRASWYSNRGGVVPTARDLVTGFRVARRQAAPLGANGGLPTTTVAVRQQPSVSGAGPAASGNPGLTPTSTPSSAPAKGTPEELLSRHGLTRVGASFVVHREADLLSRFQKIRPLIDETARAFGEYVQVLQIESTLAEMEQYRLNLSAQIDAVNGPLRNMPRGPRATNVQNQEFQTAEAIRDRLVRERDEMARTIEALRSQQAPPDRKAVLERMFTAKRGEFITAVDELKPSYDRVLSEYRALKADPQVAGALAAYGRSLASKAAPLLGPSKDLGKAMDQIRAAVRMYAPDMAKPKKKTRPP